MYTLNTLHFICLLYNNKVEGEKKDVKFEISIVKLIIDVKQAVIYTGLEFREEVQSRQII